MTGDPGSPCMQCAPRFASRSKLSVMQYKFRPALPKSSIIQLLPIQFKQVLRIILCAQRTSFQNRTDLSVPQVINAASVGECSIHRGEPIWLEGHFATFSAVIASQITICIHYRIISRSQTQDYITLPLYSGS